MFSPELLRALPKTDLHVHLDGSLRLETLLDLARSRGVALPSDTPEGLNDLLFKPSYGSLEEYLAGFACTTAVLQDPEALERAAWELARDNIDEGVRYVEVRLAPQLHVNARQDVDDVLRAVHRGLERAAREQNATPGVAAGREPRFQFGIIVCALRMFTPQFSWYYEHLTRVLPDLERKRCSGIASLQLAQAAVRVRDRYGLPVVGFDLAGHEHGYPAIDHVEAYRYAHEHFLKRTVHAGEAYGPESIFQAITALHADRLGHGYHLFDADLITSASVEDPDRYVAELAQYIADRRITLEVCITSNLQTNPSIGSVAGHRIRRMLDARLSVTLCTDNRLISHTTVCREYERAIEGLGLTPNQVRDLLIYGFKRSFYPGGYKEKRTYVRQVIDHLDGILAEAGMVVR